MEPALCEMNFLNKAKWLDMYGVDSHAVLVIEFKLFLRCRSYRLFEVFSKKDQNSVDHFVGISATGLAIYRENVKTNNYFWPRVSKIDYKRTKFYLTTITKQASANRLSFIDCFDTLTDFIVKNLTECQVLTLRTKSECKYLWKSCLDQLSFFK
jgi:hypothetical protein